MYSNTFPGENVALFTPLHLSKKTYQLVSYNTLLYIRPHSIVYKFVQASSMWVIYFLIASRFSWLYFDWNNIWMKDFACIFKLRHC